MVCRVEDLKNFRPFLSLIIPIFTYMILSRAVKITGDEPILLGPSLLQIKSGNYTKNIGHFGHIGYIGGKPGTMKSTILRYIAASGANECTPFGFKLNLGGKRIVWFDGEQPRDIIISSVNHIIELSCHTRESWDKLDYLTMFELNGIQRPVERRREMWRIIMEELDYRKDTGLIIIDGISNFVSNINNFDEVDDFMNKLTTVAKRLDCMIIVLSHLTGDGEKLYGSAGSRLDQLASFGFHMSSQGGYFTMSLAKGRYSYIAPKSFRWGKGVNELIEQGYFPF